MIKIIIEDQKLIENIIKNNKQQIMFINNNEEYLIEVFNYIKNISGSNSENIITVGDFKSEIKKADIIEGLQRLQQTSIFKNNNKYLTIFGSDKLNDYASNSLLKFLEEPSNNSIILLFTTNIDSNLITIQSRSIKIYLKYQAEELIKPQKIAEKLLINIENKQNIKNFIVINKLKNENKKNIEISLTILYQKILNLDIKHKFKIIDLILQCIYKMNIENRNFILYLEECFIKIYNLKYD